jgi:phenylpropionate dioxygenase-like ring-hydroxylating dioxygenase large terminal subunit
MSQHDTLMHLAERALAHFQAGTTDSADDIMQMPVQAYVDTQRYNAERERIFKHLPVALALSLELPKPGDYKAITVLDTPVLLVRGHDGDVRAFLNVCRHRGAQICQSGLGHTRVLACPYHAWVYDLDGSLSGRYAETSFGDLDTERYGLIEMACSERCGVIWVMLNHQESFDIDLWLGDFAPALDSLQLGQWHLYLQREIPGPGWKATMDGYLEVYHHNLVHGQTVGQHTVGNLLVLDTFGPHQRLTFGRKSIGSLADTPKARWQPGEHIRLIHSCFPNLSVSGILGDHCLVSQVFPGPTPDHTITIQTILAAQKPTTPEAIAAADAFSALVLQAVQDEDYAIVAGVQANLPAFADQHFVFGRNEPAVQNYHSWVQRFMTQRGSEY